MKRWTSLAAFLLLLLFSGAADGLMEALGLAGFLATGVPVMALAWALVAFPAHHLQPDPPEGIPCAEGWKPPPDLQGAAGGVGAGTGGR